jgi:hypothetical protein
VAHEAVSAFGMCGLGSQQEELYLTPVKRVKVVLVWKYHGTQEQPRLPNITLRTARAYTARDCSGDRCQAAAPT